MPHQLVTRWLVELGVSTAVASAISLVLHAILCR